MNQRSAGHGGLDSAHCTIAYAPSQGGGGGYRLNVAHDEGHIVDDRMKLRLEKLYAAGIKNVVEAAGATWLQLELKHDTPPAFTVTARLHVGRSTGAQQDRGAIRGSMYICRSVQARHAWATVAQFAELPKGRWHALRQALVKADRDEAASQQLNSLARAVVGVPVEPNAQFDVSRFTPEEALATWSWLSGIHPLGFRPSMMAAASSQPEAARQGKSLFAGPWGWLRCGSPTDREAPLLGGGASNWNALDKPAMEFTLATVCRLAAMADPTTGRRRGNGRKLLSLKLDELLDSFQPDRMPQSLREGMLAVQGGTGGAGAPAGQEHVLWSTATTIVALTGGRGTAGQVDAELESALERCRQARARAQRASAPTTPSRPLTLERTPDRIDDTPERQSRSRIRAVSEWPWLKITVFAQLCVLGFGAWYLQNLTKRVTALDAKVANLQVKIDWLEGMPSANRGARALRGAAKAKVLPKTAPALGNDGGATGAGGAATTHAPAAHESPRRRGVDELAESESQIDPAQPDEAECTVLGTRLKPWFAKNGLRKKKPTQVCAGALNRLLLGPECRDSNDGRPVAVTDCQTAVVALTATGADCAHLNSRYLKGQTTGPELSRLKPFVDDLTKWSKCP